MNFPLQFIELNVDETLLEAGEDLYSNNQLRSLREVEKNLWLAFVTSENEVFEAELKAGPTKVKACSCDCPYFQKHRICAHTIALMLAVRDFYQTKNLASLPEEKKKDQITRLSTATILHHLDPTVLNSFLLEYAKTDRNFALALKNKYLLSRPEITATSTYTQMLESMLPSRSNLNPQKRKKEYGLFLKQSILILNNARRYVNEGDFQSAFYIIEAIVLLLPKIAWFSGRINQQADPISQECLFLIQKLYREDLAPSLQAQLENRFLHVDWNALYQLGRLEEWFHTLILPYCSDPASIQKVMDIVEKAKVEFDSDTRKIQQLLYFEFLIFDKAGLSEKNYQLLEENVHQTAFILEIVKQIRENGKIDLARTLLEKSYQKTSDPVLKPAIIKNLFEIALSEKNLDAIIRHGSACLLDTLHPEYYFHLKNAGMAPDSLNELVQKIQQKPFSLDKRDCLAAIFADDQEIDKLLNYLNHLQSLDLLIKFDRWIEKKRPGTIEKLYFNYIDAYLKVHIGPPASQKINGILHHLTENGMDKLSQNLISFLQKEYPERMMLMSTLDTLIKKEE